MIQVCYHIGLSSVQVGIAISWLLWDLKIDVVVSQARRASNQIPRKLRKKREMPSASNCVECVEARVMNTRHGHRRQKLPGCEHLQRRVASRPETVYCSPIKKLQIRINDPRSGRSACNYEWRWRHEVH